jgi:hypothetical protein
MSRYICFTKLKHLIFLNGGSTTTPIDRGPFATAHHFVLHSQILSSAPRRALPLPLRREAARAAPPRSPHRTARFPFLPRVAAVAAAGATMVRAPLSRPPGKPLPPRLSSPRLPRECDPRSGDGAAKPSPAAFVSRCAAARSAAIHVEFPVDLGFWCVTY